ncbi:hypothetical protein PMAYCL1PPCAC_01479, partial [Pristionchus mayeri]
FIKNKKNVLNGPFPERKVQEWYRKKLFKGSSTFCFLRVGEIPCDDTPFFSLDELCIRNGKGAPFQLPPDVSPAESSRAHAKQRLRCIEEEIQPLRAQCADFLHVKEHMAGEKLNAPLSSDSENFDKWADGAIFFFL